MNPQSPSRSNWQKLPWFLAGLVGALCLWAAVKTGLAWQLLPGQANRAQWLALLGPKVPAQGQQQAAAEANQTPDGAKEPAEPTHPLIQALLKALDAFHGEGQDAKDALRNRLQQADQELRPLLKGRKEKILQLNRKPVLPLVEEPSVLPPSGSKKPTPPAGSEPAQLPKPQSDLSKPSPAQSKSPAPGGTPAAPPKSAPSAEQAKPPAPAPKPGEVQTALVRALLEVLDKLNDVSEEDRRQVRQLLLEADKDLAKALQPPSVPLPKAPATSRPSAKLQEK